MIDGVTITSLRQICDERGKVMHMLRRDDSVFLNFGEIYFSCVNPRAIKAWKRHKQMTLNCAAIHGEVKYVMFDDRLESPTYGCIQEVILSPDNYCLLTVPPLIWTGSQGLSNEMSILANCATMPHFAEESEHKLFYDTSIPYDWGLSSSKQMLESELLQCQD